MLCFEVAQLLAVFVLLFCCCCCWIGGLLTDFSLKIYRHLINASKVATYTRKTAQNMDETGLQLEHKPSRVVAQKRVQYLQLRTSGNRETNTVIARVLPHIVAKGKSSRALHGFDTQSAPGSATRSVSERGWTKHGIARLWFEKAFLCNIGSERPQILVFGFTQLCGAD